MYIGLLGIKECFEILGLYLLCMFSFGSATSHCPCRYLHVGHWKCN